MTTTMKTRTRKPHKGQPKAVPVKKTASGHAPTERHKQRDAEKRDTFPRRRKRGARPFETTMDF